MKKKKKPCELNPLRSSPRQCFICNGTGLLCDVCGEAENACRCEEGTATMGECTNCGGDGIAPLDKRKV